MEHVPTTFSITQACTLGEGTSITMHVPTSILVELMEPWSVMNFLWLESPLLINRRCTSITKAAGGDDSARIFISDNERAGRCANSLGNLVGL